MLDFTFGSADEICAELGARIKAARLAQGLPQGDLALRAGVSRGTVTTLENSGQSTLASLVRIAQALGLERELQETFSLKTRSIAEMVRNQGAKRQRARRKSTPKAGPT